VGWSGLGAARRRTGIIESTEVFAMPVKHPKPGELEPIETASQDELRALQLQRLRWTVQHAYENVPHYRQAFDAKGVHPSDLKSHSDLAKFPFTAKKDLRDNYPFGMFAVPRQQVVRIHASSGTTGKPTVVGYTKTDIDTWADLVARSIRASGGRAGDIVHIAYGYGLFTGGLGAHYGAERLGCTVIPMSGGQTEKQVQLIRDFEPDIIMVTPSYMQVIIEEFQRQRIDPRTMSVKVGIFGAEPWTEAMRHDIEVRAGIDAVDIYGLSEVMGPGVANECIETKDGPVIWEDHFYPEIIDPESGAVLPDGEEGELVFTTLTKEALPVIRYRTRDLTRLLPPTARAMRRMGKIVGRSDDMLIIRGVNVFPTQIEELVLQHGALSGQYQLVVTRDGKLDEMQVLCELLQDQANADRAAIAHSLQQRIKTLIGVSTTVSVGAPESIERTLVGKARRVIDKRPK
jgi:phenylacetate-CoA ligase